MSSCRVFQKFAGRSDPLNRFLFTVKLTSAEDRKSHRAAGDWCARHIPNTNEFGGGRRDLILFFRSDQRTACLLERVFKNQSITDSPGRLIPRESRGGLHADMQLGPAQTPPSWRSIGHLWRVAYFVMQNRNLEYGEPRCV